MTHLTIERLGARGDGIAAHEGRQVFVPGALPGETVDAEISGGNAHAVSILGESPDRAAPVCRHFNSCGGCAAQHLKPALYKAWKRAAIVDALKYAGLEPPIGELTDAIGEGRRRLSIHVRRDSGTVKAGFMARGSHTIIDIDSCPVLHPGLANAFSIARGLAEALPGAKTFDARITLTANGPDVELRGIGALGGGARLALSRAAGHLDLARLANHNELVLQRRDPFVQMGPARVTPPPGGFLQATGAAEAALAEFAAGALAKSKRIADLFCGLGPFALRLAAFTKVDAYDSDAPAIKALASAAANTPGLKPLTAITRDLFRRPLLASELAAYDAVVIDPPRAGAEAQARQIASSRVQRIVWISCDAAAFARDARILVDAGYTLERVQPFDQFQFSAHLETAALFTRKVKR